MRFAVVAAAAAAGQLEVRDAQRQQPVRAVREAPVLTRTASAPITW
jgi:hypothetical protein